MQQLCADPLYGGSDTSPNFRGYCQSGDVFFSSAAGLANRRTQQYGIRNLLECRSRCFCNYGLEDPLKQPTSVAVTRKTFDPPRDGRWRLAIPLDRRDNAHGGWPTKVTRIYFSDNHPEVPAPPWQLHMQFQDVGILPENRINCVGHLPEFMLPQPFDGHDFVSNQALCATQLSGGNVAANAGGYCYRNPLASDERVVGFADDMTPRLDWTWSQSTGSSFFSVASIRFHCWKNCRCTDPMRKKNFLDPQVRMWEWLTANTGGMLSIGTGNPFPMGSSTDQRGRPRTTSNGGNVPLAECAASPDGICGVPWPIDILGPVPTEILKLSPPKPPAIAGWEPRRSCGNSCTGNSDCGSDCLCKVPSVLEATSLGVDPAKPLCLDIGSIFGRSLKMEREIECLCNATYTASACCESRDRTVFT